MEFDIEGIDELISQLDDLQTRVVRETNKVLKESGEPLKSAIEERVNVSGEDGVHAKDDVHITNIRSENQGMTKYIEVGYGKETGWRMYFVEFGTYSRFMDGGGNKGIRPQHIIERATEESVDRVITIQRDGLNKILSRPGTRA